MRFHIETITGDLILIKTNIPTPPPCPVIAQSVKSKVADNWLCRLVLWLVVLVAPLVPHWPPSVWTANKARFTVLTIVCVAFVEVLAQAHIEKSLGVIA
jgi:hypothetical protein